MQSDIGKPELIAGCKAPGLLYCFLTKPLWSVIEAKDVNILEMNRKYSQLVEFCSSVLNRMDDFMLGRYLPFGDETCVHKDSVYRCLITQHDFDGMVETYLRVIFPALSLL